MALHHATDVVDRTAPVASAVLRVSFGASRPRAWCSLRTESAGFRMNAWKGDQAIDEVLKRGEFVARGWR